jgi:hypothetical protein
LAGLGLRLELVGLAGQRVGVGSGAGDQSPGRVLQGGRPEQVLGVQVCPTPLRGVLRCHGEQGMRRLSEQAHNVGLCGSPEPLSEEAGEEVIEGTVIPGSGETGHLPSAAARSSATGPAGHPRPAQRG